MPSTYWAFYTLVIIKERLLDARIDRTILLKLWNARVGKVSK